MMNTAIMLSLLLVSGTVLMISEGNKWFRKSKMHFLTAKSATKSTDSGGENNLFPGDKGSGVNLLDLSGGTWGI